MRLILAVALGSAAGGVVRFLLSAWIEQRSATSFPWATLLVNLSGSLLLGFLATWTYEVAGVPADLRALLTTGLCGGYTTFSTFSLETVALAEEGLFGRAAAYIALSVVLSVLGAYAGILGARHLVSLRAT
ncbi:MAG: fluoride efflux transporter CrcB [Gemmatimonadetes bacterium]|nr:fluoride efflux transporter CrcB [Gemmatimonadota bacterium]